MDFDDECLDGKDWMAEWIPYPSVRLSLDS